MRPRAEKAVYARPVPACDDLQKVVAALGMPGPQTDPSELPSGETNRRDCSWTAREGSRPPAVAAASVLIIRPEIKTDPEDLVTTYAPGFAADRTTCTGKAEGNPSLPSSARCVQLWSEHEALVTVTTFTRSAAIRVSVRYADPARTSVGVQVATVDRANSLARSTIGLL